MWVQAQKLGAGSDDDDDGLEEESLLETPLDRVEPYGLFKSTLLGKPPTPHSGKFLGHRKFLLWRNQ